MTDMDNLIWFMIYVFPICEFLTNRFDRRLFTGYYWFLCCDWFCCHCIGILNAYIYVIGPQFVDSLTQKTSIDVSMVYKPTVWKSLYTIYWVPTGVTFNQNVVTEMVSFLRKEPYGWYWSYFAGLFLLLIEVEGNINFVT